MPEAAIEAILNGSGITVHHSWISYGTDPTLPGKRGDLVLDTSAGFFVVPGEEVAALDPAALATWVEGAIQKWRYDSSPPR